MGKIRTQTGNFFYAEYQFKRSILENALVSNYTTDDQAAAIEYFGGCAFCGARNAPRKDHLVAVFECGDFVRQNVVPACQECDDSKGRKEYHDWMRHSKSAKSLNRRLGLSSDQIEKRIEKIEKWQAGYVCGDEEALFEADYSKYRDILKRMEALCHEAEVLALKANARRIKMRDG